MTTLFTLTAYPVRLLQLAREAFEAGTAIRYDAPWAAGSRGHHDACCNKDMPAA
jgi:hypothetical protein